MAAAVRQWFDAANTQTTSKTYYTCSWNAATQVGDSLVYIFCYSNDNGMISLTCTDTQGNTYTRGLDIADTTGSGDERFVMFYCISPAHTLSTSDIITISTPSTDYMELVLFAITGVNGVLDNQGTFVQNVGASTNITFNMNPGSSTMFVLAGCMNTIGNGSAPFYPTAGSGLTQGGNWFYFAEIPAYVASWAYGTYASGGTQAINFTSSSNGASSDNYVSFALGLQVTPVPTTAAIAWING